MAMGLLTFPLSFREKAINVQHAQRFAKFPSKQMRKNFENKRFDEVLKTGRIVLTSNHRFPRRGNICRFSCFVRLSLIGAEKRREKIRLVGEIKHTKVNTLKRTLVDAPTAHETTRTRTQRLFTVFAALSKKMHQLLGKFRKRI